jgi:hypothetical protein
LTQRFAQELQALGVAQLEGPLGRHGHTRERRLSCCSWAGKCLLLYMRRCVTAV